MKSVKLFGIQVSLHWSWWIFVFCNIAPDLLVFNSGMLLWDLFQLLVMLLSVLGHEFSHALTARAFGHPTRSITMHVLGGLASIDLSRVTPKQEFWISLAGPVFNLVMVALIGLPLILLSDLKVIDLATALSTHSPWYYVCYIAFANLVIGLFNLIPAYPMDGGRILRSLLIENYPKLAISLSRTLTLIVAIGFGILGLVTASFGLILLAFFLLLARWADKKHGRL